MIAALAALAVPTAIVIGHWWTGRAAVRALERHLELLHRQVLAWQASHDHQVEMIDRRMREVEASAARAENECRMVFVQVSEMSESLAARIQQVEHRIELDVIAGRHRPRPPVEAVL
jgi:hypothetical protein